MKWVSFALVLIVAAWAAWYFGVLKGVEEPFDAWMKWIGAK